MTEKPLRQVRPHTPGYPTPAQSEFLCGGTGQITPAARAELGAFRTHILTHPKPSVVEDCRFCAERGPLNDQEAT